MEFASTYIAWRHSTGDERVMKKATIHDCIRCNGTGSIWARPNAEGEIAPIAAGSIGMGYVDYRTHSMTTEDRTIVCDWCGGARRVRVEGVRMRGSGDE